MLGLERCRESLTPIHQSDVHEIGQLPNLICFNGSLSDIHPWQQRTLVEHLKWAISLHLKLSSWYIWADLFPFSLLLSIPSDLLKQTAQESLLPSDMSQNLHESLLWLLKPSFMDSWNLIILEINAGFWAGTWNDNHSWHQCHRHVCVITKCDIHSQQRQGNFSQSHVLAKSMKKKGWQE